MSKYFEEQLKASGVAQVLVVLKQDGKHATGNLKSNFGLSNYAPQEEMATALISAAGAGFSRAAASKPQSVRVYEHLGLMLGTVNRHGLAALRSDKNVEAVMSAPEFSLIKPERKDAVTLDSVDEVTWGIEALGIRKLWEKGYKGKGVLVGHLDTGIDGLHKALKPAIHKFAFFDLLGNIVPNAPIEDSGDHGTHTAGTIAGRPVELNGKIRHFGVAPEAKLVSATVIEYGDVVARVLGGMNWAVGLGVKVLNLSLGIRGYHDDFQVVTRILRNRGILPVFAVGNEGPGTSRSPGNYPEALSVGACDRNKNVPFFSSSQKFDGRQLDPQVPDLVGPGVDVISAIPGGGFQSNNGSSMATPHIAGLAALLFSAEKSATPEQVEQAIFASCSGEGGLTADRANRGLPNAERALEHLQKLRARTAGSSRAPSQPAARPKRAKTRTAAQPKRASARRSKRGRNR